MSDIAHPFGSNWRVKKDRPMRIAVKIAVTAVAKVRGEHDHGLRNRALDLCGKASMSGEKSDLLVASPELGDSLGGLSDLVVFRAAAVSLWTSSVFSRVFIAGRSPGLGNEDLFNAFSLVLASWARWPEA